MSTSDLSTKRVLILDDEPQVLRTLVHYLKGPGRDLVSCSEIEAAQCLLHRERFDVLVTDLEVSDLGGLEGIRLIRHATVHFPELAVFVFSGKLTQVVRDAGTALGVTELLEKPHQLSRLHDLIEELTLNGSNGASGVVGARDGEVTHVETLDDVLESRSISALLQPIVSLDSVSGASATYGFEGLARGPEGSLLRNPELLLDYAAMKERLFEVELQCIEAVLGQARHLPEVGRLFINVRPRSLSAPEFSEALGSLVSRYGFERTDIVLELTEQQSILNLEAFDASLATLRRQGFGLALDDFGSGFANLQLLQQLPLDYLKVDGFFCQGIENDHSKQQILRSTLDMADELGITTIIERVETESEFEVVADLGAKYVQGYYFSRPAPGLELADSFRPLSATGAGKRGVSLDTMGPLPFEEAQGKLRHELSNLLTTIALYSAQGKKKLSKNDPLYEDLEQILAASEQAVALTDQEWSDR